MRNNKSPVIEELLNCFSKAAFERERTGDQCVVCGNRQIKPEDFKDDLSRKEFSLSHMCQKCQDSFFD